jgi:hypothetical protein
MYIRYHAGTTRLVLISGALSVAAGTVTGVTSRIGSFDNGSDKTTGAGAGQGGGHFFCLQDGQVGIVERSTQTGTQVDTFVPRSSWNGDKLDGTGRSGATVNIASAIQMFWIDCCWMGVGITRLGVVVDGQMVVCHAFYHRDLTLPYTRSATLPIRFEIEKTTTTALTTASTLRAVSAAVAIETAQMYFPTRFTMSLSSTQGGAFTGKAVATGVGTRVVLISARLAAWNCRALLNAAAIGVYTSDISYLEYRLVLNGTLTGATWVDNANTGVEYDISATAITGGVTIVSGYCSGLARVDDTNTEHVRARITSNYQGVPDHMSLVVYNLSAAKAYQAFGHMQLIMDRE